MTFVKGHNLSKGRPFGAKNRKTLEWEAFADYCLTTGLRTFQEDMLSLDPKERTDRFIKILEFHKPKLARTEGEILQKIQQDFSDDAALKVLKNHGNRDGSISSSSESTSS